MVPVDVKEVLCGCVEGDGDGHGVNEFTGVFTDAFCADDPSIGLICPDFDVPVVGVHEHGFTVIIEGVFGGDELKAFCLSFFDAQSSGGDLWIGKDDTGSMFEAEGFDGLSGGVPGGDFALHNGEVNDLVWSADVACGVDLRIGGLLEAVDLNPTIFLNLDSCGMEVESVDGGPSAEGIDEMFGSGDLSVAVFVQVMNGEAICGFLNFEEACTGVQFDSFEGEDLHDDTSSIGGGFF